MKKLYTAPETSIITLTNIPTLCAGSLGDGDVPNGDYSETPDSPGGMSGDARRFTSVWDDEEDYE